MSSKLHEEVELSKAVSVLDKKGEQRGVEEWLQDVEDAMKDTLEHAFDRAISDYPVQPRS